MSDAEFTLLGPENIGCGRKIGPDVLASLTNIRKLYQNNWRSSDAHIDRVKIGDYIYYHASSIDRVACFTNDISLYVAGIFAHIENDIICNHATPSTFSFSFSFTENDIEKGIHEAVVEEVFRYAALNGLTIGKCHSYIDGISSVTGHTYGRCPKEIRIHDPKGFIVSTKQFGALKTLYLKYIGYKDQIGQEAATNNICQSHRPVLEYLILDQCIASDASGFGIDGALRTLTEKSNTNLYVDQKKMLFCSEISQDVRVECLEFSSKTVDLSIKYSDPRFLNANLSEVSGPLIILVPQHKFENLIQNLRRAGFEHAHVIGVWSQK